MEITLTKRKKLPTHRGGALFIDCTRAALNAKIWRFLLIQSTERTVLLIDGLACGYVMFRPQSVCDRAMGYNLYTPQTIGHFYHLFGLFLPCTWRARWLGRQTEKQCAGFNAIVEKQRFNSTISLN